MRDISILINMEMPTDDEILCINIHPDGKVCIALDLECKQIATAVSVPPHGDLIERDALLKGNGRYIISFGKEGIDVAEIERAPAIISASEESET